MSQCRCGHDFGEHQEMPGWCSECGNCDGFRESTSDSDRRRWLVCGGRDYDDYDTFVKYLMLYTLPGDTIIHGGAAGADSLAFRFASENNRAQQIYPANWHKYGRAAGPIRNQRMLDDGKPQAVIAFPGGRGTADMVRRAKEAGVPVYEVEQ